VIVILLDDLGYSDLGCFGAEIATPRIDALAAQGLRLANYTTVPMCTPARAALLTGKNPHSVGCGWLTFNSPGFPGYGAGEISADAPTMAELLRATGYSTYAVGKWHNTAEYNLHPAADRSAWPLQRGFDRFYGFIGGETHYFAPAQLVEDNNFIDIESYPSDYYCTDDWTDKALNWLHDHVSVAPDKPFFLYVAHNAPHAPLHVRPQELESQRGRYDQGWDEARRERLQRQIRSGLLPADTRLPEHSPGVGPWEDLDSGQRAILARYMELYAAVVTNIDHNVGRIVDFLQQARLLDNTLILITSDNGANGIGGPDGAVNNLAKRLNRTEDPAMVERVMSEGRLGDAATWPTYPLGWTDVSSTPFRLFKTTTMNGGIRVPFVLHWPAGIGRPGAVRKQWVHVTDILPTVLDAVQASYPHAFNGYRTRGPDGITCLPLLKDDQCASARKRQHYELAGNRGFILGDWKIVSLQPPGKPMDLTQWMLFDLAADPTETTDLARERPEVLAELIAAFEADALANHVYPLDNRDIRRALAVPPFLEDQVSLPRTFRPGGATVALSIIGPMIADRAFDLQCAFDYRSGDSGVLFAIGDPIAGLALFIRDRSLHFVYHGGDSQPRVWQCADLLIGANRFELRYAAPGNRRGSGRIGLNGKDDAGGPLDLSPSLILGWVGEGLDIGRDSRQQVTDRYGAEGVCRYTGQIEWVRIVPGAQAPDSYANRPERESQLD
jgi:arylsulfatase